MGSRLMHLAIAKTIINRIEVKDQERFFLGCVLPDSAVRGNSHWRVSCGGDQQTIDLAGFLRQYEEDVRTDDLVRGYYAHLLQDLLLRSYLKQHTNWKVSRRDAQRLHRDYIRLNPLLTREYDLKNLAGSIRPQDPGALSGSSILFEQEELICRIRDDTEQKPGKRARLFTEEMAKDYILWTADQSIALLENPGSGYDAQLSAITWKRRKDRFVFRVRRKLKRIWKDLIS